MRVKAYIFKGMAQLWSIHKRGHNFTGTQSRHSSRKRGEEAVKLKSTDGAIGLAKAGSDRRNSMLFLSRSLGPRCLSAMSFCNAKKRAYIVRIREDTVCFLGNGKADSDQMEC